MSSNKQYSNINNSGNINSRNTKFNTYQPTGMNTQAQAFTPYAVPTNPVYSLYPQYMYSAVPQNTLQGYTYVTPLSTPYTPVRPSAQIVPSPMVSFSSGVPSVPSVPTVPSVPSVSNTMSHSFNINSASFTPKVEAKNSFAKLINAHEFIPSNIKAAVASQSVPVSIAVPVPTTDVTTSYSNDSDDVLSGDESITEETSGMNDDSYSHSISSNGQKTVPLTKTMSTHSTYTSIVKKLASNSEEKKKKEEEDRKRKEEEEKKKKEEEEKKKKEEEEKKRKEEEERKRKEEEEKKKKEEEDRKKKEEEERKRKEEEERKRKEEEERKRKEEEERKKKEEGRIYPKQNSTQDMRYAESVKKQSSYKDGKMSHNNSYKDNKPYDYNRKSSSRSNYKNKRDDHKPSTPCPQYNDLLASFEKFDDLTCYNIEEMYKIWDDNQSILETLDIQGMSKVKYNINKTNRIKAVKSISSHLELIKKDIQTLLNKLTLENFDETSKSIQSTHLNSVTEYEAIFVLLYNKAVLEPKFSSMYAELCQNLKSVSSSLLEPVFHFEKKNGLYYWAAYETKQVLDKDDIISLTPLSEESFETKEAAFEAASKQYSVKKILSKKCQNEFENEDRYDDINKSIKDYQEQMTKATTPEEKINIERQLMDCDFKKNDIRRRVFGNIQFIGELFNHGVLRVYKITDNCIEDLKTPLDNPDEEKTESLVKLLTTIGQMCSKDTKFKRLVDDAVAYLKKFTEDTILSSRVRFAILDLLDLQNNNWQSKKNNNKLVSLAEMRTTAVIKQIENKSNDNRPEPSMEKRNSKKTSRSTLGHQSNNIVLKPNGFNSTSVSNEQTYKYEPLNYTVLGSYYKTIKSSLGEYKTEKRIEDFVFYVNDKNRTLKLITFSEYFASLFNYIAENCDIGKPEYESLLTITVNMLDNSNNAENDLLNGLFTVIHTLGDIDAPHKYIIIADFLKYMVEKSTKHLLKKESIQKVLDINDGDEYKYQSSKISKELSL